MAVISLSVLKTKIIIMRIISSSGLLFCLLLSSCNSNVKSSGNQAKVIDSLKIVNDSLQKDLNKTKRQSTDATYIFKTVKEKIIGTWTLQFDRYDMKTLNSEARNYLSQLKDEVLEFSFLFKKNMTMAIQSKLRNPKNELVKVDGVYRISKNNKIIEIERHSDEIVLDDAVQKYEIINLDEEYLILKSGNLQYILKRVN